MSYRLIVPGASGFIGKNLVLAVPDDWEVVALYNQTRDFPAFLDRAGKKNVTPVQVDLTDPESLAQAFAGQPRSFDACVFLAANGDPARSTEQPLFDLMSNTATLINFLDYFEVGRFVYFSSGAVYHGLEGEVSPESRLDPLLPYAISNVASEQYVKFHAQPEGRIGSYAILRFFGAYGPHEPERKIYTKLVRRFGIERQLDFTIRGDGQNLIDAMFVDDAIRGVLAVLDGQACNLTVDFASGTPISINELVLAAAEASCLDRPQIRHEGSVPEYIRFRACTDPMRAAFGFQPDTPLADGLTRLLKHLKSP